VLTPNILARKSEEFSLLCCKTGAVSDGLIRPDSLVSLLSMTLNYLTELCALIINWNTIYQHVLAVANSRTRVKLALKWTLFGFHIPVVTVNKSSKYVLAITGHKSVITWKQWFSSAWLRAVRLLSLCCVWKCEHWHRSMLSVTSKHSRVEYFYGCLTVPMSDIPSILIPELQFKILPPNGMWKFQFGFHNEILHYRKLFT
jgi:hypothetical protein